MKIPTLLLNKQICLANIRKMADKAKNNNLNLRPHFKTHQSQMVGRWFRDYGVKNCTVSSFRMAKYFADDGWNDITVAFPTNILEIDLINELAEKISLNLTVESLDVLAFLENNLRYPVSIFIKVDLGTNRTGISESETDLMDNLIEKINNTAKLKFKGFLGHAGHSYQARSKKEILEIHSDNEDVMNFWRERYQFVFPNLEYSIGDTPCCSVAQKFEYITEIRPGNFVFYDVTQTIIGSCEIEDIAVAMACPVVAKHEKRKEIIIYGGGVHFSKDRAKLPDSENDFFGWVVERNKGDWATPNYKSYLKKISQEHGIIKADDILFNKTKIGDSLLILPIHSCMTADLMRGYQTLEGEWIEAISY